jgi:hypothetical protein
MADAIGRETRKLLDRAQRAIDEAKYLREHVRDQIAAAKRQRLLAKAEMRSREFPPPGSYKR